ncbi:hypothetical protein K353_04129 [Kitasatospora sp. SolWspMP-SS2h]|uniref:effector-associated constant component EACC1 n=1 Tax=Kitasatospora sp. SolWspMP-SS2h TaxID=1305729 RepID=UPI000DBFC265|nr:hypothetical protein [Kitasatospora sp. SolWspMP-SS2h]RAJ38578.1 hypothetical protein K353_04129 [Kitasatospora sp. SolWspMP-SS2h]
MSTILITFDGSPETVDEDARDLRGHLDQDDELRGRVGGRLLPAQPGTQGTMAEAVEIAQALGPVAAPLISAWVTARLRRGPASITVRRADGAQVTVSGKNAAETAELIEQAERLLTEE